MDYPVSTDNTWNLQYDITFLCRCVNGRLVIQTPLLGKEVYYDIINRFPSRFDNPKVHESINAGSVAPKVELQGTDGSNAPFLSKGRSFVHKLKRLLATKSVLMPGRKSHVVARLCPLL